MKAIVRSAEPEDERRKRLVQSNTGLVGLRDFLLDGADRTALAALRSFCIRTSRTRNNMEALLRRYLLALV